MKKLIGGAIALAMAATAMPALAKSESSGRKD